MKIRVPATSANIGPGFDSLGLAVSRYLTVETLATSQDWLIRHDLPGVPTDADNLLIKTALRVKPDLQPHTILMTSDIPLARGLGSSSSVIVAGIELANQLGNMGLTAEDKLQIATEIEGHPDNVAPAIYGNLVVSTYVSQQVSAVVAEFPETGLLAFIPDYELKTSDSRGVLPESLPYSQAVEASSIANVAVAALLKGDLVKAGKAIEADQFHENYRQKLVKEFPTIKQTAQNLGSYAVYLSGAGPAVMILAAKDKLPAIQKALEALNLDGELAPLEVDRKGVLIED